MRAADPEERRDRSALAAVSDTSKLTDPVLDAVVVGAGFSGLYMLKRLRDLGLRVRVFEAGSGVGGTWFWNRYPGARCDLESIDYSYSFSEELQQEWVWTERYAAQPELLAYLEHVADRLDLRRDIQLQTTVTAAAFDEETDRWTVTTDRGDRVTTQFLVMATGALSAARMPELPGLSSFRGRWYHTGRWPHDGADFTGDRVGIIGTGSSGVQSIPVIAEQAASLVVFQRTPNYVLPARNRPLPPEQLDRVKANYPSRRTEARASQFGIPAEPPDGSALAVDAAERQRTYQKAWDDSHLLAFRSTYHDILTNQEANDTVADFLRDQIRSVVRDPDTAEELCPRDFPFGTKRPCLGLDYYETFNRDNVSLVDIRQSPIVEITETGVRTSVGHHELDSLVFATGFDAVTGAVLGIDIRGRGQRSLREKWSEGPRSYLGIGTAGFPNLFLITGPGSPSVISNMVVSIEQHVEWVSDCVAHLRRHGLASIEAEQTAEDAWVQHVHQTAAATLYLEADSWYLGANVPGKPRVFMPYLGGVGAYREICDDVAADDYRGFTLRRSRPELSPAELR